MKWKNTWILVGLCAAVFAFIWLFERHLSPTGVSNPPQPLFTKFKPTSAAFLQIRRGNQFTLVLERTNGGWRFTKPVVYPAADFAVQAFLEALERIVPAAHISPREILARKQTAADFGFDPPPVVVALGRGGDRPDVQIRIGARTAANDQVYVAVDDQPGYFVVSSDILDDKLPRNQHDWRDTALFHFGDDKIDRAEIAHGAAKFELALDPTNKLWRLARPSHRANQFQVRELLDKLQLARAIEFVTDDAAADVEAFGLQTPEFELTLASGAAAQKVQFGRSPTNDPGRVYARILAHTNVVLVPKNIVDLLGTPYAKLRDQQLVAFAPELVDVIEGGGEESFVLRKNASGLWMAGTNIGNVDIPADPVFVSEWLALLNQIEVTEFVKDVVTDFAPYGLAPGKRQYTLRTTVTNAIGPTNVIIAQLEFGTNAIPDRAFAHRLDEDSVYSIRLGEYMYMPGAAWQFRDHRVWKFTTNQVVEISVQQTGDTWEALRQPNGEWVAVKGFGADLNPFALEEVSLRLGELKTRMWLARGEKARAQFGFEANAPRLMVKLQGEKPQVLTIEF